MSNGRPPQQQANLAVMPAMSPEQTLELAKLLPENDPFRIDFLKAILICNADTIPKHARGKPATVMFLKLRADELNIPFGLALEQLYPTPGGKIGMESKLMRRKLLEGGCKYEYLVDTETKVVCKVTRPDGQAYSSTWTEERAKGYRLSSWIDGKKVEYSLYQKWLKGGQEVQNMLRQRALAEAAREIAPDKIGGALTIEEAINMQPSDDDPASYAPTPEEKVEQQEGISTGGDGYDRELVTVEMEQALKEWAHKAGIDQQSVHDAILDAMIHAKEQPDPPEACKQVLRLVVKGYQDKANKRTETRKSRKPSALQSAAAAAAETKVQEKIQPPDDDPWPQEYIQQEDGPDDNPAPEPETPVPAGAKWEEAFS